MGIFSKKVAETYECKRCGNTVPESDFFEEFGLCTTCMLLGDHAIKSLQTSLGLFGQHANEATDPDKRISYLKLMLEALYEYKINYTDKEIDLIDQDIDELIDDVVQHHL